jgi:hypothetical protein
MIAGKVLHRRRKRFAVISGAAGLALAASFSIILNVSVFRDPAVSVPAPASGFMSAQIEGSVKDAGFGSVDDDFFEFAE